MELMGTDIVAAIVGGVLVVFTLIVSICYVVANEKYFRNQEKQQSLREIIAIHGLTSASEEELENYFLNPPPSRRMKIIKESQNKTHEPLQTAKSSRPYRRANAKDR